MTQVCRLGLPVLLHCLTGPTAENPSAQELLKAVLDRFVEHPEMDVTTDDNRLWQAVRQLLRTMGEVLL